MSSQVLHRDGLFSFFSPSALSLKTSRGRRPPSPSCRRPCRHWAFRRVSSEPFGGYWQPSTTWARQGPVKVRPSCPAHLGCQLSALAGAWQSPSLNEAGQGQCHRLCVWNGSLGSCRTRRGEKETGLGFSSKPSRPTLPNRTFCDDEDALYPCCRVRSPLLST